MKEEEKYLWEVLAFGKEKAKERKRIRNRVTYKHWRNLFNDLKRRGLTKRQCKYVLQTILEEVDNRRGWGSATHYWWASESLKLLLEDKGVRMKDE